MSLVEKISQMQKMGMTDEQIVKYLRDEGISPKEISEAVDQSQIKSAVAGPKNVLEGMSPSLMSPGPSLAPPEKPAQELQQPPQKQAVPPAQQAPQEEYEEAPQEEYYPEQQSYQEQQPYPGQQPPEQYPEQQRTEQYLEQQSYQEQQPYPGQQPPEQYPEQQGTEQYQGYPAEQYQNSGQSYDYQDTGAISDIAEQIVDEKLQKIGKEVSDILRFRIETDGRLASLNERVRRIELIIDRLQSSILGKIGGYEKDISSLKQELETTQESFSKVLEPLPEKPKRIEHPPQRQIRNPATKDKHHKKSDALAHYLRR